MSGTILLIEDDQKLAEMIRDYLGDFGLSVTIVGNGKDGLERLKEQHFNAIVLDLMLPDMNGLDICKHIRNTNKIPILMLTAKGDPMDRVIGLELGADDYMPKPFEPRELLARIRVILRRGNETVTANQIRHFGRLKIDIDAMTVSLDEKECDLTAYQYQLLLTMSRNPGRVLSRDFLMNELQGNNMESFDRSIDVHISRIRSEIEDNPKHPRRIITIRGTGYVFARGQDEL